MNWQRLKAAVIVSLSVTGCVPTSNSSLLDTSNATLAIGETALFYQANFISEELKPAQALLIANGQSYRAKLDGQTLEFSFHPISGKPIDHLLEVRANERAFYVGVSIKEDIARIALFPLFVPAVNKALNDADLHPKKAGDGYIVNSKDELMLIVNTFFDQAFDGVYPIEFKIARTSNEIIQVNRSTQHYLCLAHAGDEDSPELSKLPEKFAFGVDFDRIDLDQALEACKFAEAQWAPPDARLALAKLQIRKSIPNGYNLLNQLQAAGYGPAYKAAAEMHLKGKGFPKDKELAHKLLKENTSDPYVSFALGRHLLNGVYLTKDTAKAKEHLENAVRMGNSHAKAILGYALLNGDNFPASPDRGKKLIEEAISEKSIYGYAAKGLGLITGVGYQQSYEEAFKFTSVAAERGLGGEQFRMGMFYLDGQGVQKDPKKAFEWFERSAANGVTQAMVYMGEMLYRGDGVPADRERGLNAIRAAVSLGDPLASKALHKIQRQ